MASRVSHPRPVFALLSTTSCTKCTLLSAKSRLRRVKIVQMEGHMRA